MISEEQFHKVTEDLKKALARIEDLENWQEQHIGIDVGATGKDYPHPYQKVAVLEAGRGKVRLGIEGIQIVTPEDTYIPAVAFVDELFNSESPSDFSTTLSTIAHAQLKAGQFGASLDGFIASLIAQKDDNQYGQVEVFGHSATSGVALRAILGGVTGASIQVAGTAINLAGMLKPLGGLDLNIDESGLTPIEGQIWYDSATQTLKFRTGSETIELPSGGGMGIITDPHLWNGSAGYEYWLGPFGGVDLVTASGATNLSGLDSFGWTATSLLIQSVVAGSSVRGIGDLNASSDDDPVGLLTNASGDMLSSPPIFGGYSAFQIAERLLGSAPTKLCLEFRAAFSVASANETASFIGLTSFNLGDSVIAGSVAAIVSDGTNFLLKSDTGSDTGAAIDTSMHTFRIEVGSATTEWFIDGVSQGTITTEADTFPTAFTMRASTTNRPFLAWARVYYE